MPAVKSSTVSDIDVLGATPLPGETGSFPFSAGGPPPGELPAPIPDFEAIPDFGTTPDFGPIPDFDATPDLEPERGGGSGVAGGQGGALGRGELTPDFDPGGFDSAGVELVGGCAAASVLAVSGLTAAGFAGETGVAGFTLGAGIARGKGVPVPDSPAETALGTAIIFDRSSPS